MKTFFQHQSLARRNSRIMVVLFLLAVAAVIVAIDAVLGVIWLWTADAPAAAVPQGVYVWGALVTAAVIFLVSLFNIARLGSGGAAVARMAGARLVASNTADPLERRLRNVVEEMAIAAGLPMPRVAIIESEAMNAFATGMYPESAAIGVTRGLLDGLSREELQGVIAHEMGHILNWDTRYMTAVGILVGLIALLSDAVLRARWHRVGSSGGRRGKGGGAAVLIILAVVLIFAILAPIAGRMVQFAVSRQREFLADATSVQLTRNPLGLIAALQKLGHQPKAKELGNRATQHLFIVNPIREFGASASALMATHPAIEDRIERLTNLGA